MSDKANNNKVQLPENKEESQTKSGLTPTPSNPFNKEMPTVTTLLARKKLTGKTPADAAPKSRLGEVKAEVNAAASALNAQQKVDTNLTATPMAQSGPPKTQITSTNSHKIRPGTQTPIQGGPPLFAKTLIVESLNISAFKSNLSKHKKYGSLKKLDCLGYFLSRFSEIAYFELNDANLFTGIVGFGTPDLVTHIQAQTLNLQALPSLGEIVTSGEFFVGPAAGLRDEDTNALVQFGFTSGESVGVFPTTKNKQTKGVWICFGKQAQDVPPKELKVLKKLFTNIDFSDPERDFSLPFPAKLHAQVSELIAKLKSKFRR